MQEEEQDGFVSCDELFTTLWLPSQVEKPTNAATFCRPLSSEEDTLAVNTDLFCRPCRGSAEHSQSHKAGVGY